MSSLEFDYQMFIKNIKLQFGIDLSLYKETQMKRRLTSLREKRGFPSFKDYFHSLKTDEKLFEEFLDRMTINVSEFFRNYSRWDVLSHKIIPLILKGNELKCWSSACSTGEEPYTLAMILEHYYPQIQSDIVASDIDERAISKAKEGIYLERSLKEMPEQIKRKYFRFENNVFYVNQEIKRKVKFKKVDLLLDKFEGNYDLIICRNVMIYFTDEAKHLLYQKFSNALRPGGVLFVGSTEQIFNPRQYQFETVDNFFYQKRMD